MIICLEKLLRAALTSGATVALSFGTLLATTSASVADDDRADLKSIKHIIVIYQAPSPVNNSAIDPHFPSFGGNLTLNSNHTLALSLIPYDFTTYIPADGFTGDIVHRFYHEQLQIDKGVLEIKNVDLDKFVYRSDNPGLFLSYIDATDLPEGKLAQQYTLCDNFFHSVYGGSFLNHQWFVAASTPPWTEPIPDRLQSSYDVTK